MSRSVSKPPTLPAWLAFPALVVAWPLGIPPVLIALGSAASFIYYLWFAPAQCRAKNRVRADGAIEYCRNNAPGLLRGCHIKQHKTQKRIRAGREALGKWWHDQTRELWSSSKQCINTMGVLVSVASGVVSVLAYLIPRPPS